MVDFLSQNVNQETKLLFHKYIDSLATAKVRATPGSLTEAKWDGEEKQISYSFTMEFQGNTTKIRVIIGLQQSKMIIEFDH